MVTSEGDLVVLHPCAIQPQNADMADMVMPAGVDTPGNLDLQRAEIWAMTRIWALVASPGVLPGTFMEIDTIA